MKSEVCVGQSLFNVHSTTGLSEEGWDRGTLCHSCWRAVATWQGALMGAPSAGR